nr:PREDICTED: galactoside 2-alpha-L-fucosyltransferase-like isoform X1 [Musa acuminata subsp. malaccensis]
MDGKRVRSSVDLELQIGSKPELQKRSTPTILTPGMMIFTCFMFLPLMVLLLGANRNPSFEWLLGVEITAGKAGSKYGSSASFSEPPNDKLLGGLLSAGFDEASCLSRYQSALYRKQSNHTPSPYLVSRLRRYEALHRRCGPNTELYQKAIEQLKSNRSTEPTECNYVVWVPSDGLGNRIITIVSAFLYAVLTDKVLLVDLSDDLRDLFCEPFPGTSWILPSDFPVNNLESLFLNAPLRFRDVLGKKLDATDGSLPSYLYLHLTHDQRFSDHMFFCEEAQPLLQRTPWLLLRSNQYFVPALFRASQYEKELSLLFPMKSVVFHHLGRYLLHPANPVWGYITRYYDAYLGNAKEMVGLQIRIFEAAPISSDQMIAQILNCSIHEGLLPEINLTEPAQPITQRTQPKAVLLTTLYSGYFEKLRNMYYQYATTTGEAIAVYQPSHEEQQHTEKQNHNKKALMEMYLLSCSGALITSGYSTFGYVAQALGGLRPWILLRPDKGSSSCLRATSMEPCFHSPQGYQCIAERSSSNEAVGHVRECEDVPGGLKLVD